MMGALHPSKRLFLPSGSMAPKTSPAINPLPLILITQGTLHTRLVQSWVNASLLLSKVFLYKRPNSRPSPKTFLIFGHILYVKPKRFLNLLGNYIAVNGYTEGGCKKVHRFL